MAVEINKIYSILKKEVICYDVPVAEFIKVQTDDPFKILIATILSARTKDETTARVCKRLFDHVSKIEDLEKVSLAELEKLLFPVGFYRNKAKHLKKLPSVLKEFNGKIPNTIDELVKLPGVGRKTANLVVSVAFDDHAICVDTHVHRILNRIGFVKTKSPHETEIVLRKKLEKRHWKATNRIFVPFGQKLCRPISPHCSKCPIYHYCLRIGVLKSR